MAVGLFSPAAHWPFGQKVAGEPPLQGASPGGGGATAPPDAPDWHLRRERPQRGCSAPSEPPD
eukprot:2919858-Alexandrium_andersonii.AAC.1